MTYEDFAKKFIEVACDSYKADVENLYIREAIEIAWKTFGKMMIEEKISLQPNNPVYRIK
jgi:hypothetical protein